MRIRKKQHGLLHGAAFLVTGGMSAPVSAAMMGAKAVRNQKADDEVEYLAAAMRGEPRPATRQVKPYQSPKPRRGTSRAAEVPPANADERAAFRRDHVPGSKEYRAAHGG